MLTRFSLKKEARRCFVSQVKVEKRVTSQVRLKKEGRVRVEVNRSSESKSSLCLSLKRKVEFTLGTRKLTG